MYSAVASCLVGIFPPTAAHFASFSCEQSHSRNLAHASLFSDPLQTPKFSPPIALVLGVPAAYGMGRYRVKGGNVFLLTFLISQMLPPSLTLTPMYLIFSKLGFLGNHLTAPVAIAASSIPFVIVTLRPYFRSIPVSLDEAARLDGCGSVKAFLMVMLPAVKTGIITIMVISFLNGWNDLVYSMTFNVAETMRPLTANIYKFQSAYGTRWNCIMAYGAILVLPVILMFIFLQKYIVGGLVAGAVKD